MSGSHTADCGAVTFDSKGRIVTVCVGLQGPSGGGAGLHLLDPQTLDTLAKYDLPPRQPGANSPTTVFTDFAGGGYFYLDDQDRAIVPTTTRHVFVMAEPATDGGDFTLERDYDLTAAVPDGDKIISALPDWGGRLWFASTMGVVGWVDRESGELHSLDTGEPIGNSFAVDETGGVYVVTDAALYRFVAGSDGKPQITYRRVYENTGVQKHRQTPKGSGTTPTLTPTALVAITDNADPMNITVYRKTDGAFVCRAPVF